MGEFTVFRYEKATELPKYYAQLQMAFAHGLGCPAGRQVGPHIDAAPKHFII